MKKILCIVAHPDDEALGPGGTLIKHSLSGEEVNIFIFSDGEGAKKDIKKKNSKRLIAANTDTTKNIGINFSATQAKNSSKNFADPMWYWFNSIINAFLENLGKPLMRWLYWYAF